MRGRVYVAVSMLGLTVVALTANLSLSGCASKTPASPQGAASGGSAQPVHVETIQPTREDLRRVSDSMPAELLPYEQTDLTAKIAGYVRKVNVDIGDRVLGARYNRDGRQVEEGQVLAELWVPEMVEELKQKVALIAQAKADVKQAEAAQAAAAANLKTAEAAIFEAEAGRVRAEAQETLWSREYQRLKRLSSGVIDETTIDKARMELDAAKAMRGEVEAKVQFMRAARDESAAKRDKAVADVAAAKARIAVAEAIRDQLQAMLQYAKLTAPYDGVVTKRYLHAGAYIRGIAGEMPLLTIVRTDKLRLAVDVSEKDVRFLRPDTVVEVDLDALPGRKFAWKISRFAPVLGVGKKVRVEVHIPNPDSSLYPGMYGHAVVVLEHKKDALTLPATCLNTDEKGPFVFTVQDGKAKKQQVTLGINDGKKVEITSGLSGAEEIIRTGKDAVHDGQPVTARSANASPSR